MPRLLYFAFPTGRLLGGHKMILRHVEALQTLGFNAVCVMGPKNVLPPWVEHRVPILTQFEFHRDDVIVLPDDAQDIRSLFTHRHPTHAELSWRRLEGASERLVAQIFSESSLFLCLSRLESVGMTPLEAMASNCVCAGFLGVGGREFGTSENGFWVPDDDCEAAADALAQAADVVASGGTELHRRIEAGRATAARWSYSAFRETLEAFWMKEAPQARLRARPLD
jgi:glycosyltransferase involved in cell wall biosynthesis